MIAFEDFLKVDIRIGTITAVEGFPEARKALYRLQIDFGSDLGELRSAAGLPLRYDSRDLVDQQILAAVNLGTRRIAGFESQCLTLGVPDEEGEAILLTPTRRVPNGGRLF